MNLKKTIVMAIIAIVAVAFYYWDNARLITEKAKTETTSRLVTPPKDQISELNIHVADKSMQLLKKGTDDWQITQPLQVRADSPSVQALVDEIDKAKRTDPFEPQGGKLEGYGLAKPVMRLEVKAPAANYVQQLELGNRTSDGSEVYAHQPKEKTIFTVPASLQSQVIKPVKDYRYKWVLQYSLDDATSASLQMGGKAIEIEKRGENWNVLKPLKSAGDPTKIKEDLSNMNRVAAADFIDTHPLNMQLMGFDKPALTAHFTTRNNGAPTSMTLVVGKEVPGKPDQVYAMYQGLNYAMTITRDDMAKFWPELDDLRSKKVFSADLANTGRVIFTMPASTVDLTVDSSGKWHFIDNPSLKVDQAQAAQTIGELLNLRATKFVDGPTTPSVTGLDQPFLRLTVQTKDGKSTETVATGRTAPGASPDGGFVFAKIEKTGQVIGVNDTQKLFMTHDRLLDKAMFNFDDTLVKKVEIKDSGKTVTITAQPGGGWSAKPEGAVPAYSVDGSKMSALILSVGSLNWSRRLDPNIPVEDAAIKANKLDSPLREIVFYDADGKQLARLGQGADKDNLTYVRRGDKDYFAVDKLTFNTIRTSVDSAVTPTAPAEPKK